MYPFPIVLKIHSIDYEITVASRSSDPSITEADPIHLLTLQFITG